MTLINYLSFCGEPARVLVNGYFMVTLRLLSKVLRLTRLSWLPLLIIFLISSSAIGQDASVTIAIGVTGQSTIKVTGRYSNSFQAKSTNFYFLNSYAGIGNLGKRVSDVQVSDGNDRI